MLLINELILRKNVYYCIFLFESIILFTNKHIEHECDGKKGKIIRKENIKHNSNFNRILTIVILNFKC